MKKLFLLALLLINCLELAAQYRDLSIRKSNSDSLKIVQVDLKENSTLIHFQYINTIPEGWICAGEDFYIEEKETSTKYKLISSHNLPLCDKKHSFDKENQVHYFSLEFEKVPGDIKEFNIIEKPFGKFNFYGVSLNPENPSTDLMDIPFFLKRSPAKEYSVFFMKDNPVFYYKHKGVLIAVFLTLDDIYKKYYQANILIQNLTGKEFVFDPKLVTCNARSGIGSADPYQNPRNVIYREKESKVFSYNEFMKKVSPETWRKHKPLWDYFAGEYSEKMSSSEAGKTFGNVITPVYFPSAYKNEEFPQTFQVKNSLSEGYFKQIYVQNETEHIGFLYIAYKRAENLQINIPVNGTVFTFSFDIELE